MSNNFSKFKKIILASLIFVLSFFVLAKPSFAYPGTEGPSYFIEFEEALGSSDMNLQSFVNETFKAVGGSMFNLLIGPIKWSCSLLRDDNDSSCLSQSSDTHFYGLVPTSIMLFSGIYQYQPASGVQYFADLGKKIGIVQPAFAANSFSNFKALEDLQDIWKAFRNLSYIIFALILVAMGFAIMFRVKISPQAVISIQSALPKVIIALILITFSYAIVGLILDISMFINSTIAGIFVNMFQNEKSFSGLHWLFTAYSQGYANMQSTASTSPLLPFAAAHMYGRAAITAFFIASASLFGGIGILVLLIIGILSAIAYLRALWVLIRAFAMIIINLIFAPIRILMGVLPGSNAISDWFKDLISNVAILPGMLCLYFVGNYLILKGVTSPSETLKNGIIGSGFGIYGAFWMLEGFFLPIIGIFILLMIPKVSDIIQSFITKKPFQYGTAIGEAMGPVMMGGKMAVSGGMPTMVETIKNKKGWQDHNNIKGKGLDAISDLIQSRLKK